MCIITELDKLLPTVLTDLLCGFLELEDIRIQMNERARVYSPNTDSYGLRIPLKPYHHSVWNHRWCDIDLSAGVQLLALRELTKNPEDYGDDYRGESTLENVLDHRGDILSTLFMERMYDSGHPNCGSGFDKWLRCCPDQITESEWEYISDHWDGVWKPRIMTEIQGYDERTFRMSGMDVLVTYMIQASLNYLHVSEACIRSSLEYIKRELTKRQASEFLLNVWIPHRATFLQIHESLKHCENEDKQFNELIKSHLELWNRFLFPPLTHACPYPHIHRDSDTGEWSPVTLFGIVET